MTTRRLPQQVATAGLFWLVATATSSAQVAERDVTVTGPRGNSVERKIVTERNGPFIDRQVTIKRPGGTITRNSEVFAPRGGYGRPYPVGRGFGPGPFVAFGAPFVAAPAFSLFVGSAPPPVAFGPPPVVAAGPPLPPPLPPDAVAVAVGKFKSLHSNIRREGALTLGHLKDPRGVSPLIDRLEHDMEKEVRMAAAWSLAEIGDPRAVVALETARQFDKRADVRAVAEKSLSRMPRELPPTTVTSHPAASSEVRARTAPAWTPHRMTTPSSTPAAGNPTPAPPAPSPDDLPPPDPTPVAPRSASAPASAPR
jgi:hypothetical protein